MGSPRRARQTPKPEANNSAQRSQLLGKSHCARRPPKEWPIQPRAKITSASYFPATTDPSPVRLFTELPYAVHGKSLLEVVNAADMLPKSPLGTAICRIENGGTSSDTVAECRSPIRSTENVRGLTSRFTTPIFVR